MKLCKYFFLMSFPAEGVWLGKIGNNLSDSKAADASFELGSGFLLLSAGEGRGEGCQGLALSFEKSGELPIFLGEKPSKKK